MSTVTVKLVPVDPSLPEILHHVGSNRTMSLSKARLIASLYNPCTPVDPVTSFKLGSGGIYAGRPRPVSGSERDLNTPITSGYDGTRIYHDIPLPPEEDTSYTTVSYALVINPAELIGQGISEVGLFTLSGKLFSMKTFPQIPKDGDHYLVITWSIPVL